MSLSAILRVFAVAAVLFALIVGGVVLFAERDKNGAGGATSATGAALIGGAFSLVDQNGKTRTDAEFRGKYMLVYFGYTYCPDFCPTELNTISDAMACSAPTRPRCSRSSSPSIRRATRSSR